MRVAELLLEYKRDITLKNWGDKLIVAAKSKRDSTEDISKILSKLEQADPTKNKQYVVWIVRQYIDNKFRLEDVSRINDVLSNFDKLKNKLPLEQRNINKLDLHKLEDIIDTLLNVDLGKEQDIKSGRVIPKDAKVLYDGPLGLLVIPETKEASCELGKGTKWCTAADKNNMFDAYSTEGLLYIWIDKSGQKYQFHFEEAQFMDDRDRPIEHDVFMSFRTKHPVLSKLFKEKEKDLYLTDAFDAYSYAAFKIRGRWPEAEPIIMKDAHMAYRYAKNILEKRWPEAESTIKTHSSYWQEYKKTFNITQ